MYLTDPIADMLTRVRNANAVMHEKVDIPHSNRIWNHPKSISIQELSLKENR